MKTLLTTIATLAVAILFHLAPTPAAAQNPDICEPDCDSIEFGSTQYAVITLAIGCVVRVHYAQRTGCNGIEDLGIIKVEMISSCANYPTAKDMLNEVSELMIRNNPMGWTMPPNNQCIYTQRIVKGACWTIESDCDHDSVYVACDSVACCVVPVVICKDEYGELIIDFHSPILTQECDSTLIWCEPVCEEDTTSSAHRPHTPELGIAPVKRGARANGSDPFRPEPRDAPDGDRSSAMMIGGRE